jgi:Phosphotransferase enzyme family
VPTVLGWEAFNPLVGRSYLLTSEVAGRPLGPEDSASRVRSVLLEAGYELSILNSVRVEGFGWIVRSPDQAAPLRAEHQTWRNFLGEYLEGNLELLAANVLSRSEMAALRRRIDDHVNWFDAADAHLAHGDFDTTPILQVDGRYSGIIDFSEVRGTSPLYDLGHFHLHDGHRLAVPGLQWLLDGYRQGAELPPDHEQHNAFYGLLIGVRRLARSLRVRPAAVKYHRLMAGAVRRELDWLG